MREESLISTYARAAKSHLKEINDFLQGYLGSGTTLIAAQSCGRICFAIELDPLYVDVAVKRWQAFTGEQATLLSTGQTFEQVTSGRAAAPASSEIETHVGA